MIYSASRRTDLPAFWPEVICGRVARSRKLDALLLWTKDVRNLVGHAGLRAVLGRVPTVVQLTLTGLAGTAWEPRVPPPAEQRDALGRLTEILPPGALRWRFDPILPRPGNGEAREPEILARFLAMRDFLRDCGWPPTEATISFPSPYRRAVARVRAAGLSWPEWTPEARRTLAVRLAAESGLTLRACCDPALADVAGLAPAACIDGALFDRLYGTSLASLPRDAGQREGCGCTRSTEIGSYDACAHGCLHCYARPEESSETDKHEITKREHPKARTAGAPE